MPDSDVDIALLLPVEQARPHSNLYATPLHHALEIQLNTNVADIIQAFYASKRAVQV